MKVSTEHPARILHSLFMDGWFAPAGKAKGRRGNIYHPTECANTNANARRRRQIEQGRLRFENGLLLF